MRDRTAHRDTFLAGGGEMGERMRAHDWAATPLGPMDTWPLPLLTMVCACLNSPMLGTVLWGPDLIMLYNDAYIPSLADRHPHALGIPVAEVWGDTWELVAPPFLEAMTTGEGFMRNDVALPMVRRGLPELTYWNFTATPIRGETGDIAGLLNQGVEITEQHRTTAELRELNIDLENKVTERAFARGQTWRVSPDILGVLNAKGHFEVSNPAWAAVLGWSEAEVARTFFMDFIHPDDHAASQEAWDAAILRGSPALRFENRYRHKNGDWRWLSWVAVPDQGKVYCSARDITQVKESEKELASRTAERDRMWETSPDLMLVIDFEGVFQRVNPAWTAVLGYSADELVGHHVNEFVLPDDHLQTQGAYELAAEGGLPRIENRYRHKDGSIRWISWVAAPAGDVTYATGRDITTGKLQADALLRAEEALRQSQKMEAIGQLTGGVAHDFNNLLTVIKSSTDLLRRPGLAADRQAHYVSAISDTVDRAAKLTVQLLAFARRQTLKPEVFDAVDSVRAMSEMLTTLTGSRIRIVTRLPNAPCFMNADPSQFDTALVNMAINARDAMNGEGQLTICVESVNQMPTVRLPPAVPGSFIAVSITDTGGGIPDAYRDKIFEPFFTTKGVGQGTGLGLSQVFGFAKQSGGEVTVSSTVGNGSTFTLYLPQVNALPYVKNIAPVEALMDGHGTCVLVVEDNTDVGTFAVQTLADLGYVTVWAANAAEAMAELAKDAGRFDVVFSDVVMPGMNGIDLAHEIRRQYQDLPVLLTSGYSHILAQNGTDGFELLQKPYSVEQLSRLLRKVAAQQRRA
ncbi:histidine kinase [Pseudomonas syringae]|uniref:hybrid sensor histidine kinase/response regulator n=1 Tax=Pseudomonas syringae TaxID=317 RepID=UPI001FDA2CE7|nr:PAS domain-containing sensor histidine kinase [Pseudomonas syringae]MCI3944024.1 histidine kinase [Pseudomonas syringae]